MNSYATKPLPANTVEVARKNVYTGKPTKTFQTSGKTIQTRSK